MSRTRRLAAVFPLTAGGKVFLMDNACLQIAVEENIDPRLCALGLLQERQIGTGDLIPIGVYRIPPRLLRSRPGRPMARRGVPVHAFAARCEAIDCPQGEFVSAVEALVAMRSAAGMRMLKAALKSAALRAS